MARPQTNTVSYFSHDTDASEKKTLTIIKGQFGLVGVGFWWELLQWLGKTENHYYDGRRSSDLEFLLRKIGLSLQNGTEILDKLAFEGAIDPMLWEHKVIWSQNFVSRLSDVYKKRGREIPLRPDFCNGNCDHSHLFNTIPATITPLISPESPHNIVYNNIVDNIIGKLIKIYEEQIGKTLTPTELELLKDIEKTYPINWFESAVGIARDKKKFSLHYVEGILKNRYLEENPPKVEEDDNPDNVKVEP